MISSGYLERLVEIKSHTMPVKKRKKYYYQALSAYEYAIGVVQLKKRKLNKIITELGQLTLTERIVIYKDLERAGFELGRNGSLKDIFQGETLSSASYYFWKNFIVIDGGKRGLNLDYQLGIR